MKKRMQFPDKLERYDPKEGADEAVADETDIPESDQEDDDDDEA